MIRCKMWSRYLLWFAHEHVDFRHAEIQSILSLFNIPIRFIEKPCIQKPYWIVELPDEDSAKKIASRSVSLKNCIELWSRAKTTSQLHANIKSALQNNTGTWIIPESNGIGGITPKSNGVEGIIPESNGIGGITPKSNGIEEIIPESNGIEGTYDHICPSSLIEVCCPEEKSFKIDVETFCRHFTLKEKVEKIEMFAYLPLKGPIRLRNPEITLAYLEFYGMDPNNIPDQPYDVFFGRWIADGQRDLIKRHSLKTRSFIGNTSMDAQLSLLMANQARVVPGDLVVDPFVGSGSLLVAAAHFGAYVWGSDIDYMMLHARSRPTRVGQKVRDKEESIRGNMRQYELERRYLDVLVGDFSRPSWREELRLDAVITDPPYGVREPPERIGIEREHYTLTDAHLVNHIPAKVEYALPHIYSDLMTFSAKQLRVGGRLVCWYPLVREEYRESQLPSHPCLKLVANSEQVLSRLTSRRLLTYEKCEEFRDSAAVESSGGAHNFREKYLERGAGEMTRREKREKRAEEVAVFLAARSLRLPSKDDEGTG